MSVMKFYGNLILMTVICVAIFTLFMARRAPAQAQRQAVQSQQLWPIRDFGRNHGYVTSPGMPKCNPTVSEECRRLFPNLGRAKPSNSQPTQTRSSKANHCDSVCQAKCQATWQRGGLPSVEACYAKWSRLHANGTARQCEAANRAKLPGQPRLPGC